MTNRSPSEAAGSGGAAGAAGSGELAATPAAPAAPSTAAATPVQQPGTVRVVSLDGGTCRDLEGDEALVDLRRAIASQQATAWVDLCGASPSLLAEVSKILDLHPLLVEDLAERDQRAKLEQIGELIHMVVFSIGFDDGKIYDRELDFVLGERFLLSSHSRWWDPRATRHLRSGMADAMRRGPGHLLWALCDDTIDAYFPMLDRLGDEIDTLEDEVVARADRALLERLFELKRSLILIRRITAPEREMFNMLSSREEMGISADERLYFRDGYDHLIRLTDELDTYRELASATLETYLSTVNNNLSLIMKRLTGVTVVVAGIGAVGGIFGMSEAQSAFRLNEGPGFWIVTAGCIVIAGIAAAILHKIDWI
ncbi:MAG: magnesium transporter CorA family protein [Candidatus Limnocylindrales bacterium]|jgi:magnesium transporter